MAAKRRLDVRTLIKTGFIGAVLLHLTASAAFAQATIAGVVRDSSGAVLPGVTVEASSPALTEKVRTAVTDGTGQYRIVTLPPGTYVVKFSLTGFTTVQRDDVTVSGSGVIPDQRRPARRLAAGDHHRRRSVAARRYADDPPRDGHQLPKPSMRLPITRNYGGVLYATPGLIVQPGVNDNALMPSMSLFSAHGGISTEGRVFVDGVSVNGPFGQNSVTQFAFDVGNAQEMQVMVGGGLGESETGGPIANIIPKSGGNTYSGSAFFSGTQSNLQADNITDDAAGAGHSDGAHGAEELGQQRRARRTDRPRSALVLRQRPNDRHCAGRRRRPGAESQPRRPDEVAVRTHAGSRDALHRIEAGFLGAADRTGDANAIGCTFSYQPQYRCLGSTLTTNADGCRVRGDDWIGAPFGSETTAPEAGPGYQDGPVSLTQATWTSPVSSRHLVDAAVSRFWYGIIGNGHMPPDAPLGMIGVHGKLRDVRASQCFLPGALRVGRIRHHLVELARGMVVCDRRPRPQGGVSGHAHAVRLGVVHQPVPDAIHVQQRRADVGQLHLHVAVGQRQSRGGALDLRAGSVDAGTADAPGRASGTTASTSWAPEGRQRDGPDDTVQSGAGPVRPDGQRDRLQRSHAAHRCLAYDLFGNGKTALKASAGKYLSAATADGIYSSQNQGLNYVRSGRAVRGRTRTATTRSTAIC